MALSSVRRSLIAASFLVAAAGAGCVDMVAIGTPAYVEREERRFSTTGRPEVSLATFDGAIEVRSWDRPEVLIEIEKRASDRESIGGIDVAAVQRGDEIDVDVRLRAGVPLSWPIHRSARLRVSMPASSNLTAATGDGSIDVEGLSGRVELRSGDGSIRGSGLSGELKAQTGDGSIRLDAIEGRLDVNTADGSIVASGRLTALRARTADGSVTVRVEPGSAAAEDWQVITGDGSVTLDLPDGFNANLDANTGDGRVLIDGLAAFDTVERSRRSVRARLGEGGRELRVRSGDGTIRLGRN